MYDKQNFVDGMTLEAAHLNHIEEGIYALAQILSQLTNANGVSF